MNDERLIELVRSHPVLYDLSHPKYMENSFKIDIWIQIGQEMEEDGSLCKTRWNNIRDNYRKSLKRVGTRNGRIVNKIKYYKYSQQLSFLNRYFDERNTQRNTDSQKDEEDDKDDDNAQQHTGEEEKIQEDDVKPTIQDLHDIDLQMQPLPSAKRKSTLAVPRTRKSTKKVSPQQTATEKLIDYLVKRKENQTVATSSLHSVDTFLAGVAPTLKTFTPYYLNLAKSEIFASVQKYDMKMVTEQQSYDV